MIMVTLSNPDTLGRPRSLVSHRAMANPRHPQLAADANSSPPGCVFRSQLVDSQIWKW
jgi:hypothetical protein